MAEAKISCPYCDIETIIEQVEIVPFAPKGLRFACPACKRPWIVSRSANTLVIHGQKAD